MTVYPPGEDSFLLEEYVKELELEGARILDMGTGSGIIALAAAEKGSEVTAADVDPEALEQAKRNAEEKELVNIEFIRSDLFENVQGKFDYIFFNPPYLPGEKGIGDENIWRGGEKGIEVTRRFLESAESYLAEGGEAAVVLSSRAEYRELVEEYGLEIIDSEKIWFETLYLARSK